MGCTVEQDCRLQKARALGSKVHLDHLVAVQIIHVMVSFSAMIDYLVARKTLVIMFRFLQEMWQQLGHVKLDQWSAAFVHLVQVEGKFSNMKIISAKKASRPHHVQDITVIPEGCKIAGCDDAL
jgi:hypothetical protein